MGNWSYFMGCPSREAAAREDRGPHYWNADFLPESANGWGPCRTAKYCVPLFWVGCFVMDDAFEVQREQQGPNGLRFESAFMGLWTTSTLASQRLHARRDGLLELLPAPLRPVYRDLCKGFADAIVATYPAGVFFDGEDVFGMIGNDEAAVELERAMAAFERLDLHGVPPTQEDVARLSMAPIFESLDPEQTPESAAHLWRVGLIGDPLNSGDEFAPGPTPNEIEFANSLPRIEPRWKRKMRVHFKPPPKPWRKIW